MKIPVSFSYMEFTQFSVKKRRNILRLYLTERTLKVLWEQKYGSKELTQDEIHSELAGIHYLSIAKETFEFREPLPDILIDSSHIEELSLIDEQIYVELLNRDQVQSTWVEALPFRTTVPSEIEFFPNGPNLSENSFSWKVKIPDAIDLYYLPLKKKEMRTLNLIFQAIKAE
ncbi:hypothetical protein [Candidatus Hodarchaeum mangrovi]